MIHEEKSPFIDEDTPNILCQWVVADNTTNLQEELNSIDKEEIQELANQFDKQNFYPLMFAVMIFNIERIETLIPYTSASSLQSENSYGTTILDLLSRYENKFSDKANLADIKLAIEDKIAEQNAALTGG